MSHIRMSSLVRNYFLLNATGIHRYTTTFATVAIYKLSKILTFEKLAFLKILRNSAAYKLSKLSTFEKPSHKAACYLVYYIW